MAKQDGAFILKGTIGGVCFYIADGVALARQSNPLSSKRVKTAPEFAGLRRYSDWLRIASPIASEVYHQLPDSKQRFHYQQLTGIAIRLLKEGKPVEIVREMVMAAAAELLGMPEAKKEVELDDKKVARSVPLRISFVQGPSLLRIPYSKQWIVMPVDYLQPSRRRRCKRLSGKI